MSTPAPPSNATIALMTSTNPRTSATRPRGVISSVRRLEKLGAGSVGEPAFPQFRRPAASADEQKPHVGMVERPEDVGSGGDVKPASKRALAMDDLDDRALVLVEVGVDQIPEGRDVGVYRCAVADHFEQGSDAHLHDSRVARGES